ncbi:hypothetical protein [Burkholderia cepacia]|uniref:Uncharacterized protein n=1 Tax=Burkholderia cepacia GG4 TaxID=1009846 RepID=A0A9W3K622_BURCE|nr:hypothetical protein [Burkholderia cepacia]AFQ51627.1 hypothetical protein GEM_5242 [Burkholderia cepacia GG4]
MNKKRHLLFSFLAASHDVLNATTGVTRVSYPTDPTGGTTTSVAYPVDPVVPTDPFQLQ